MVEGCPGPIHRRMASLAHMREARLTMVRIRRCRVIRSTCSAMALIATLCRGAADKCQLKIVIYVTRRARRRYVRSGQSKTCDRMIKRCAGPIRRRMTSLAHMREAPRDMVWIGRR